MTNEIVSCVAVGLDGRYLVAITKDGKVFYGWASGQGFHPGWDKITWTRTTDIPLEATKV